MKPTNPPTAAAAHRIERAQARALYHRYLRSLAWRWKRVRVLWRDRGRCQICGRLATDVHHLTYARKYREPLYDLLTVCRACHDKLH